MELWLVFSPTEDGNVRWPFVFKDYQSAREWIEYRNDRHTEFFKITVDGEMVQVTAIRDWPYVEKRMKEMKVENEKR